MYTVFLLTGSNQGDRLQQLRDAEDLIATHAGKIIQTSKIYETASWGNEDLPPHLNQILVIQTELEPKPLLIQLQEIENQLGRKRSVKWGLRTIDIDIIYFENFIIQRPDLKIPHPLLQERRFTLVPLTEVTPDFIHPIFHKTNQELLEKLNDPLQVILYEQ